MNVFLLHATTMKGGREWWTQPGVDTEQGESHIYLECMYPVRSPFK